MSGALSLVASMLTWSLLSRFSPKNIIILSVSAVFFFAAISIQNYYDGTTIISRVYNISDDGFSSLTLQTRLDTYAAAWEQISKNPFIGIGLGPNIGITKTGYVVHNIFLLNWFESGLFGILGILIILGAVVIISFRGIRDPQKKAVHIIGIALFSSFIAFLVLGIAQPIYYKRFGWISAALLLSLYSTRNESNFRNGPKFCPKNLIKQ
jgi:O-antigen ligase